MAFKIMFVKEGKEKKVGQCETLEAAKQFICDYVNQIGFKSYYQRYYKDNPIICDYGSHTSFFHIYKED